MSDFNRGLEQGMALGELKERERIIKLLLDNRTVLEWTEVRRLQFPDFTFDNLAKFFAEVITDGYWTVNQVHANLRERTNE